MPVREGLKGLLGTHSLAYYENSYIMDVTNFIRLAPGDNFIVSKVSKWDNLVLRSADFYCQNVNNLKCTLVLYLYSNEKKGK